MLAVMADTQFDDWVAGRYERLWPELFEPAAIDPVVDLLAGLAGGGRALELGVGTGRIALPLSRRGVEVHGVDLSPAMVARLRAQPGADRVGVTVGDFARTRVGDGFALVYLLRNTITNLTTQDEQVECFRTAAGQLAPGGRFVVENYVPELQRLPPGETVHVFTRTPEHLGYEEYDLAAQIAVSHHHWTLDGEPRTFASSHRYVWPAELDLMARIAGLVLEDRWSDWHRTPFTGDSRAHVSVWARPAQPAGTQ